MPTNETNGSSTLVHLLERLHACGERLYDALMEDNLETALLLLNEREGLMGQLKNVEHGHDRESLRPMAAGLSAQNDRIAAALELRGQALEAALNRTMQMRRGNAGYAGRESRRKVLRTGLKA